MEEPRLTRLWAFSFGVATFLGLASGVFVYFGMMSAGHAVTFGFALREGFTDWYFWAPPAVAMRRAAVRPRRDR